MLCAKWPLYNAVHAGLLFKKQNCTQCFVPRDRSTMQFTRAYYSPFIAVISLLKFHQLQADTSKLLRHSPRRVRDAYGSATTSFYLKAKLHSFLFFFPTEHDHRSGTERTGIWVTSNRLYTTLSPRKNSWLSVSHPQNNNPLKDLFIYTPNIRVVLRTIE